ncbi:hypothetical protein CR513_58056, partial [Mucuna pruriens]
YGLCIRTSNKGCVRAVYKDLRRNRSYTAGFLMKANILCASCGCYGHLTRNCTNNSLHSPTLSNNCNLGRKPPLRTIMKKNH